MTENNPILIYTDGASRKNPGPAAAAFLILRDDKILHEENFYLGVRTNNQAEYQAIIKALLKAKEYTNGHIIIQSDSELVIKQINGDYRVNNTQLKTLRNEVFELNNKFTNVEYFYVPRKNSLIKHVDKLCNQVLNKKS